MYVPTKDRIVANASSHFIQDATTRTYHIVQVARTESGDTKDKLSETSRRTITTCSALVMFVPPSWNPTLLDRQVFQACGAEQIVFLVECVKQQCWATIAKVVALPPLSLLFLLEPEDQYDMRPDMPWPCAATHVGDPRFLVGRSDMFARMEAVMAKQVSAKWC